MGICRDEVKCGRPELTILETRTESFAFGAGFLVGDDKVGLGGVGVNQG